MGFLTANYYYWLHETYYKPEYPGLILSVITIAATFLAGIFGLIAYLVVHGVYEAAYAAMALSILSLLLLFHLLYQRQLGFHLEVLSFALLGSVSTIVLSLDEPMNTFHLLWFAVVPIYMTVRKSILVLLFSGVLIALVIVLLRNLSSSLTLLEDDFTLIQFLLMVEFFGMSVGYPVYRVILFFEKNHYQAIHDHLTGLYNRHLLDWNLEYYLWRFRKEGEMFYLIFADLDHFKEINDLFGHEVGDDVLKEIGKRLQSLASNINAQGVGEITAYRFGGDEFVFIINDTENQAWIEHTIQSIVASLEQPYTFDHYRIQTKASAGIVRSVDQAHTARDLIWFADISMFENKRARRVNFPIVTQCEGEGWEKKFEICKILGSNNYDNQFYLVFQPVYTVATQKLVGCEVLLRWNAMGSAQVSPPEFILIAEATGTISRLTQWLLEKFLVKFVAWQGNGLGLFFSVNISPIQLREYDFVDNLQQLFASAGVNNLSKLEFEITETSPIINSQYIAETLRSIKQLGIGLALDDYGQGNTSFLNLQSGEFQKLKIDKALLWGAVNDRKQFRIIEAVVNSAHSLGLEVTIEGVETHEHLAVVQQLKCDYLQGFLFSKPLTEGEFEQLLVKL